MRSVFYLNKHQNETYIYANDTEEGIRKTKYARWTTHELTELCCINLLSGTRTTQLCCITHLTESMYHLVMLHSSSE